MPLYQPTFIVPSTLTGTGTVVATDNVHFSWQVNGNVPMSAFKIEVYTNDAASTLVHAHPSTGYDYLVNPFYGADENGIPVRFTFDPEDEDWDSWGLVEGRSYKFKITMLALASIEGVSRVEQYSESVINVRSAPTISISNSQLGTMTTPTWRNGYRFNPQTGVAVAASGYSSTYGLISLEGVTTILGKFSDSATICYYSANDATSFISSVPANEYTAVSEEYEDTYLYHLAPPAGAAYFTISKENSSAATYLYGKGIVDSISTSFAGTISYDTADSLSSVRWVLKDTATGKVVKDTGRISTPVIAFTYDGLSSGSYYRVTATIETGSGLSASGSKLFYVDYPVGRALGGIEVICNADESVTLSLPEPLNIPGTPTPASLTPPTSGTLTLTSGQSVSWGGDETAPFPISSDCSIAWKGNVPSDVVFDYDVPSLSPTRASEQTPLAITRVDVGLDERRLASADSGKITISGEYGGGISPWQYIENDFFAVYALDFSPDGQYLAAGGYISNDLQSGVRIYKLNSTSRYALIKTLTSYTDPVSGNVVDYPGAVRTVRFQPHPQSAGIYYLFVGGRGTPATSHVGFATCYATDMSAIWGNPSFFSFTLDGSSRIDGAVEDIQIIDGIDNTLYPVILVGDFAGSRRLYEFNTNIVSGGIDFKETISIYSKDVTVNTAGTHFCIGSVYCTYSYTGGIVRLATLNVTSGKGMFSSDDTHAILGSTLYAFFDGVPTKITDVSKTAGGSRVNAYASLTFLNYVLIYDKDTNKVGLYRYDQSSFNLVKLNASNSDVIKYKEGVISAYGAYLGVPQYSDTALVSIQNGILSARFFGAGGNLKEVRSASLSSAVPAIESISIEGAQTADFVYISSDAEYNFADNNYTPFWNSDTLLYADFKDGFQAGTVSTSGASEIVIYRSEPSGIKRIAQVPTNAGRITDYGTRSNVPYRYNGFYASNSRLSEIAASDSVICKQFRSYTLIEASTEDGENFSVVNTWQFAYNLTPSAVSNNNSPSWLSNFTPYPLRQRSTQRPKSGTLSGLLGKVYSPVRMGAWASGVRYAPLNVVTVDGVDYYAKRESIGIEPNASVGWQIYWSSGRVPRLHYADTAEEMEKLYAVVDSTNDFFIRDTKGNLYMVGIDGAITETVDVNSSRQEVSVSIPWREVGSAENVSLIKTESVSDNGVLGVTLEPDPLTGQLFANYPSNYNGTTFDLN